MVNYRPKREAAREYKPSSGTGRRFTSYKTADSDEKKDEGFMKTIYPKGWLPPVSSKRGRTSDYSSKLTELIAKSRLEKKLGVVAAALIGGSFVFFTPNITGNVIWGLPVGNTNSVGAVLFVLGVFGMLFCTRKK